MGDVNILNRPIGLSLNSVENKSVQSFNITDNYLVKITGKLTRLALFIEDVAVSCQRSSRIGDNFAENKFRNNYLCMLIFFTGAIIGVTVFLFSPLLPFHPTRIYVETGFYISQTMFVNCGICML